MGYRAWSARKNNSLTGLIMNKAFDFLRIAVIWPDLRIDFSFSNATCDQLGNLRTKIQNQNLIVHGFWILNRCGNWGLPS